MDTATEAQPLYDLLVTLVSGGGLTLLLFAALFVVALGLAALFLKLNKGSGRRSGRRTRAELEQDRRRRRKDMVHRIRGYARLRQAAVAEGLESPEMASRALRDYGAGVLDALACSTRNVTLIESLQGILAKECRLLESGGRHALTEPGPADTEAGLSAPLTQA